MTHEEVLDFYDEHWNDYAKVVDMLHNVLDSHEAKVLDLEKKLTQSYLQAGTIKIDESKTVSELKELLQECQDRLDEETHKVVEL